ncbi:flagellar export chaperone FliS [Cupriavidus numazuensis]|uniref:Flagellar secretion chaperone FliS n=1 Tax=Cupriavidus numazuensis TaxID=221992 RepID=A0ABM8TCU4_9BURK|nr:flagellar export chaperone FliS [Cupriavidus numazuensis]CAG2135047.1 Flagellar secretion chaperone FliS [Cupriavidus numazuensis]
MFARSAANTYAAIGVQTKAMSASPTQLIAMLYDGARTAIARAKFHLDSGDVPARGNAISKAIDIIENGLRAVLDHEAGGEIASNLESLYEYMVRRLLQANLQRDAGLLTEVDTLLESLASAWAQLDAPAQASEPQPVLQES